MPFIAPCRIMLDDLVLYPGGPGPKAAALTLALTSPPQGRGRSGNVTVPAPKAAPAAGNAVTLGPFNYVEGRVSIRVWSIRACSCRA